MEQALEECLRSQLSTSVLRPLAHAGGGCISEARSYETDSGPVFVKHNTKSQVITPSVYHCRVSKWAWLDAYAYSQAQVMFEGEAASLKAILETNTLRVPKPVKVLSVTRKHDNHRAWPCVAGSFTHAMKLTLLQHKLLIMVYRSTSQHVYHSYKTDFAIVSLCWCCVAGK